MQTNSPVPQTDQSLHAMAQALAELRDNWVEMSCALSALLTEQDSPKRDETLAEVARYLAKLGQSAR